MLSVLERKGYSVVEAVDASEALAVSGTVEQKIDLLISGVILSSARGNGHCHLHLSSTASLTDIIYQRLWYRRIGEPGVAGIRSLSIGVGFLLAETFHARNVARFTDRRPSLGSEQERHDS